MKTKYVTFILLLFLFNFCSCQTIIDLKNRKGNHDANTYYKDIDNRLNQFDGTWVYDNGTDYIKLILLKKVKAPIWQYYEDILIGGFQYKHNGIEIINTISQLNTNLSSPRKYDIWGNYFKDNHTPFYEYTTDNFRLNTTIKENGCLSDLEIRTLILNGQSAIQIFKRKPMDLHQVCTPVIPEGFYYLIKQ